MITRYAFLFILIVSLFLSCRTRIKEKIVFVDKCKHSTQDVGSENLYPANTALHSRVPFENIASSKASGYSEGFPCLVPILDDGDCLKVASISKFDYLPRALWAKVDFKEEIAVLVFMGCKSDLEYNVDISQIYLFGERDLEPDHVVVNAIFCNSNPYAIRRMQTCSPWVMVKIKKKYFKGDLKDLHFHLLGCEDRYFFMDGEK